MAEEKTDLEIEGMWSVTIQCHGQVTGQFANNQNFAIQIQIVQIYVDNAT